LPESISIYFQQVPGELRRHAPHFEESLGYGEIELIFRDHKTWKVFNNHHLTVMHKEKYPWIIDFASYLIYPPKDMEYPLDEYEITVDDADDIEKLYADPEFKKLNEIYAKESKVRTAAILKELENSEAEESESEDFEDDLGVSTLSEKLGGKHIKEERNTPPNSPQILKEGVSSSSSNPGLNALEDTPTAMRSGGGTNSQANSSSNSPKTASNPISPVSNDD
jgi:hypothetical protein